MYNHERLIVWKKADELAHLAYRVTRKFPKEEDFRLVSQIRRAAVSVPTNIVEGVARQNKNETKQFINIALGSLAEIDYLFSFSKEEGFVSNDDFVCLKSLREQVGSLLWKFYQCF